MIAESRKREPSAKICKQIDKLRQASCRVRPLAVGTITKKTGENLFGEIAVTVVSKYCVMLVGTLWGLPNPVNGNPRQKFASKLTNDGKRVAAYVPSQSVP